MRVYKVGEDDSFESLSGEMQRKQGRIKGDARLSKTQASQWLAVNTE